MTGRAGWIVVWGVAACGARAPLATTPVAAPDGTELEGVSVRLAVIGGAHHGADALDDLRATEPDLVLLVGDVVERGTGPAWDAAAGELQGLPASPLPGRGERRRDRDLERFEQAWSGLGVAGVERPTPWRHLDADTDGARWRVVLVDVDREGLGERWRDQLFWLPKALGGTYERLLVVTNHPPSSLAAPGTASDGIAEVRSLIREHVPPGRLVAWIAGGTGAMELLLPDGVWNEAVVIAGCADPSDAEPLPQREGELALAPALGDALVDEFVSWRARGGHDPQPLRQGAPFAPPEFPVCGWWEVELAGSTLTLGLHVRGYRAGWSEVFSTEWSPATGWGPAAGR